MTHHAALSLTGIVLALALGCSSRPSMRPATSGRHRDTDAGTSASAEGGVFARLASAEARRRVDEHLARTLGGRVTRKVVVSAVEVGSGFMAGKFEADHPDFRGAPRVCALATDGARVVLVTNARLSEFSYSRPVAIDGIVLVEADGPDAAAAAASVFDTLADVLAGQPGAAYESWDGSSVLAIDWADGGGRAGSARYVNPAIRCYRDLPEDPPSTKLEAFMRHAFAAQQRLVATGLPPDGP